MSSLHFLDPNPNGSTAVLLLHGLGATGSSWALQFDSLAEAGFRPLAPDAPGFGESPYDGHGWSISRVSDAMADLLIELGVFHAHVVGISMGGTIAQQLALDHPAMIKKLVLVSTFSVLRPKQLSGWFYFLQRFLIVHFVGLPAQAEFAAKRIFPGQDQQSMRDLLVQQITRADPRAYRAAMRSLGLFDSSKRLKEITAPTLVVSGDRDTTVPMESQVVLVKNIPSARHVIISNAGHAVIIDQPEAFNAALLEFLLKPSSG
jgi:pimeloyl-ACP methyl ester carboxylesterase